MTQPTTSPSADLYRYERKYHAVDTSSQALELLLRTHPALFREVYPPRVVDNVYLDAPGLTNFAMHVHGAATRAKLRVRWYGEDHGRIERPILEVKARRGAVGTKHHYPLPPLDFDGGLDVDALRARLSGTAAALLASAAPAIFNRYRRRYWCTADGRYRVTVDTELEFRALRGRDLGPLARWREERLSVIELKYDVADDLGAASIAARFPWPVSKYSKYVYGIERLTGLRG